MRIIFIENRYQTRIWERIARGLEQDGHQIGWIVQNVGFSPGMGKVYRIPYPRARDARPLPQEEMFQRVLASDRNANYFGGNASHYVYYRTQIERIIDAYKPDVVFGECTLFHELLCSEICRAKGIYYLHPTCNRYPPGRFSFYLYDTLDPLYGSGEVLERCDALQLAADIAQRRVKPDYMQDARGSFARIVGYYKAARNAVRVTASYLGGERYNTPSLLTKFRLHRKLLNNQREWERLAALRPVVAGKLRVLYAMQMQPETNLDVWGRKYRDQVRIIEALVKVTDEDCVLLLKPNPHSKYEISDEMLTAAASSDRVVPLSHRVTMDTVFPTVDVIVTVTGTVAIEAIFAGKPVVTLAKSLNNSNPGCVGLPGLSGLPAILESVRRSRFRSSTDEEKIAFMQLLTQTSYPGIISDLEVADSRQNRARAIAGFRHMLSALHERQFQPGSRETDTVAFNAGGDFQHASL